MRTLEVLVELYADIDKSFMQTPKCLPTSCCVFDESTNSKIVILYYALLHIRSYTPNLIKMKYSQNFVMHLSPFSQPINSQNPTKSNIS